MKEIRESAPSSAAMIFSVDWENGEVLCHSVVPKVQASGGGAFGDGVIVQPLERCGHRGVAMERCGENQLIVHLDTSTRTSLSSL